MAEFRRTEGMRAPRRTRGRPTPEVAARIDREILDVARELFFSQGYERTSMAMIIRAAEVSKTTLYARYQTKAALFQATVQRTVDQVADEIMLYSAVRQTEDLEEGLRAFGTDALRICLSPLWANYERLIYAEGQRFPELSVVVGQRSTVGIASTSRFIKACAERDGIPCRDAEAIASVYIRAVRGFFSEAILRNVTPSEAECSAYVDTLVRTLMASRETW